MIQASAIDLTTITYLVVEDADRMLQQGFESQIRKVMLKIRPNRQMVMMCTKWSPDVRRLAESYMENSILVCVGGSGLRLAAAPSVTQVIKVIDEDDKFKTVNKFNFPKPHARQFR